MLCLFISKFLPDNLRSPIPTSLPIQYPSSIRIFSYNLCILDGIKLTDILVSLADIGSFSFLVMAVEFQQDCRRCSFIYRSKTFRRYTIERTVQHHTFRIRIVLSFIIWQAGYYGILAQSLEGAVVENITMVLFGVSDPYESAVA